MELTEKQQQAVEAYERLGSEQKVAAELGCDAKSIRGRLYDAIKKGWQLNPNRYCDVAPAGFGLDKQSILTDANGEIRLIWHKVSALSRDIDDVLNYLKTRVPATPPQVRKPKKANAELMLEWCLFDHHQGLLSWAKETGADYDNKIARTLMVNAARKIFEQVGQVQQSVIIGGGDNLHADNRSSTTEKSHHSLDTDSRYHRTAWIAYETWATCIDIALCFSEGVRVVIISGNHDYHASIHLAMILSAHYRDEPRVFVDISPAKHKFYRFGANYFMASHGDTGGKRLAPYLLNHIIKNNLTGIERKYVRAGHIHKRGRNAPAGLTEDDGVVVEVFPTIAAPDAYAAERAYSSIRATVANLWHSEYGQRARIELGVKELLETENKRG